MFQLAVVKVRTDEETVASPVLLDEIGTSTFAAG